MKFLKRLNKLHTKRWSALAGLLAMLSQLLSPAMAFDVDLQNDTIYQIMVDRFYDGDPSNNATGNAFKLEMNTELDMHYMKGGDWQGVIDKMDYIQQMGFTAIWISPIADPQLWRMPAADGSQFPAAYHGYNAVDPNRANRYFGNIDPQASKEKLKELVDVAHQHGIKVIIDVVPNHVGDFMARDHYIYPTNVEAGTQFEPVAPFNNVNFYHHNGDTDFDYANSLSRQDKMNYLEKTDLGSLDDIDYDNPQAKEAMLGSIAQWFDYLGADGARVDAAKSMFPSDINALEKRLNVPTFGENFDGDLQFVNMWLGEQGEWGMLDFPLYFAIQSSFLYGNDFNADGGIKAALDNDAIYGNNAQRMVTFIDNHDRNRMLAESWGDTNKTKNAIAFIYAARGVPVLFQGTEAEKGNYLGRYIDGPIKDSWNRWPMVEKDADGNVVEDNFQAVTATKQLIGKLNNARKEHPALRYGKQREMWQSANLYAFSRRVDQGVGQGNEVIAVFSNAYTGTQTVSIPLRVESTIPTGATLVDLLNPRESFVVPADRKLNLTMQPNSHRLLAYKKEFTSPSTPTSVKATQVGSQSVSLSWSAASDTSGIAQYQLYRNGVHVKNSATLSVTDSGLKPETTYQYQVKAIDNAGNSSALSAVLLVTTGKLQTLTTKIYYKRGFATPFIHYQQANGTWTTAPGVALTNATGYPGYSVSSAITLGASGKMMAVFNDGKGNWDNNGGNNYQFTAGVYTFENGVITAGTPGNVDTTPPSVPQALVVDAVTAARVSLSWQASTDDQAMGSYNVWRNGNLIGISNTTAYTDTSVAPTSNYQYQVTAVDAAGNESGYSDVLNVDTPASTGVTVTFNIYGATTVPGQDVYIVGNHALLGNWAPANASGPGDGTAYPLWKVTTTLPANTSVEFKAIIKDQNGNVTWEPGANNAYTTPASGNATVTVNW